MKRNEVSGEVVLTDKEFKVTSLRDLLFDQGGDADAAAEAALNTYEGSPSKNFVEWLSQGRLTKDGKKVVPVSDEKPDTTDAEKDAEPASDEVEVSEPEPAVSGS
jgi:hypothetical protein